MTYKLPIITASVFAAGLATCLAAEDLLIADFEGKDYGNWKTTGEAFGPGPAQGSLPGQMAVSGFVGKGLVNSFFKGDGTTGTLTSPEFKIGRKYIIFLIGGGMDPENTSMNLVIDGKIVRIATGPNDRPGGSEALIPGAWDVTEFAGKSAVIRVVDNATGGWGHVSVDQIVQTDAKPAAGAIKTPPAPQVANPKREIKIDKRYLNLPIKDGARNHPVSILVDGKLVMTNDIGLADGAPDWWAFVDAGAWRGKTVTVTLDKMPADSMALSSIEQSDLPKLPANLYQEALRGQFHFSSGCGWNNDPNGMVFSQGEYHLYYQYNPYGWSWGNMHWGHAVSRDMVHWKEQPIAIYKHAPGDAVFSGSAVVDKNNTSGWKKGADDLIVAAFTSTGRGECIAFSNDRGCTFTEYEGNPVVKHAGRDPRLLWYAPGKHWVMAVYDEFEGKQWIAFLTSPDLKKWTFQSRIDGFFECPDIFELPLNGDPKNTRWILTAASSEYRVGSFDGKTFTPETPKLPGHRGAGFYAAQTFSNNPQGQVVQIGWFQTNTPGMPFNQSMSIPLELNLAKTADGPRLTWTPTRELASLRGKGHKLNDLTIKPGAANPLAEVKAELVEVNAEFTPGDAGEVAFTVRGANIVYDVKKQELVVNGHRAPAPMSGGKQSLRIYCDRTGLEVFASGGLTYVPMPFQPKPGDLNLTVSVKSGDVRFSTLQVHELRTAWE